MEKKCVVVGVTSSVAAFKAVQLVSDLLKLNLDVEVIMTKNATEFITPLQFSSLTKHQTYVDTFARVADYKVEHISLAKKADAFIIAPATANVIAKVVNGLADDMLTTTFLAATCPKIIAPAMNTAMYDNPITQANLNKAREYGIEVVEPTSGLLACGDSGRGKLADIDSLIATILKALETNKILSGKHVLVSAGPTQEALDPVRYISNHSSGKMGYEIARAAYNMGAEVTLVSGPTNLKLPYGVKVINIKSAQDMFDAITSIYDAQDYVIKAAAVADFRPASVNDNKIKKQGSSTMEVNLVSNPDILKYLGEHKTHQKICGFAMETQDVKENAYKKFKSKNCDMLVVNDLFKKGAGFKGDTNVVSIFSHDKVEDLELMSKKDLAKVILEKLVEA